MQAAGLLGELAIKYILHLNHSLLQAAIQHFIFFDAIVLLLLVSGYRLLPEIPIRS
jgi:hypothetical protein